MPECEICFHDYFRLKTLDACKHKLCRECLNKILDIAAKNSGEPACPFCRTYIKEADEDYEIEYWKNLESQEWITYSVTLRNGTEIIKTYRSSDYQPSWRNDDNVIILKRNRTRKKYRKNKGR
mgnify:CR=1 FL=1